MDNELGLVDYSRQREMDEDMTTLRDDRIHVVVGCGGVGFWLGMFLAMNGAYGLIVCDGQTIDATNLNRIPVPQTFLGRNKAIALRKTIKMLRPECLVSVIPLHVTDDVGFASLHKVADGELSGRRTHMVWDCTDNARVQRKLSQFCLARDIAYRKLGYEGYKVGYYTQMEAVWFDEATYQPGYRTSRANAMSSALTAAFGIFAKGLEGRNDVGIATPAQDITIDIKNIIRTGGQQCTTTTSPNTATPPPSPTALRNMQAMTDGIQATPFNVPTNAVILRRR